jgi:hypothetical protein
MKFPPIAIWVALFALLSCAAEGRGFGSIHHAVASADVCEAQAKIASFSSEFPHPSFFVCDFQRALGAMDLGAASTADHGAPTLLVTVGSSRVCLTCPASTVVALWGLASPTPAIESALECTQSDAATLSGPPPGVRFSYCLAPHAPPQAA